LLEVQELVDKGIGFISLSDNLDFTNSVGRLHFQILSAFSEFERSLISERTKEGLNRAKNQNKKLGRPKGVKNKSRVLDSFKDEIKKYLAMGLMQTNILKIINSQLGEKKVSLTSLRYFISTTKELNSI
jgi:DNA invertase Pin-like site-specific DNA recombinase